MTRHQEDLSEFDRLIQESADADEGDPPVSRRRMWRGKGLWLPVSCVVVGGTICAGAVIAASLMPDVPATPVSDSAAPVDLGGVEAAPVDIPDSASRDRPVSDMAASGWVTSLAERTGIPVRALRAYTGASLAVSAESPGCGIGWNTLAGIGFVESEHGTIHGSVIGDDGVARPDIIGIPLTGEVSMAIRDTDGGELDGDTVWDRAVGPMQFIPETWERWGADGNRDGVADPQNIDDSALAAARYLCAAGGNLVDPAAWIAAIHAYNPSIDYNNRVAEAAQYYGSVTLE